jgi:hypothetical protein
LQIKGGIANYVDAAVPPDERDVPSNLGELLCSERKLSLPDRKLSFRDKKLSLPDKKLSFPDRKLSHPI